MSQRNLVVIFYWETVWRTQIKRLFMLVKERVSIQDLRVTHVAENRKTFGMRQLYLPQKMTILQKLKYNILNLKYIDWFVRQSGQNLKITRYHQAPNFQK